MIQALLEDDDSTLWTWNRENLAEQRLLLGRLFFGQITGRVGRSDWPGQNAYQRLGDFRRVEPDRSAPVINQEISRWHRLRSRNHQYGKAR